MVNLFSTTFKALDKSDRTYFVFAAIGKIAISALDVVGVILLGLSVALLSGATISESSPTGFLLRFLGFTPGEVPLEAFGAFSLGFFLFKVVISLAVSKLIGNWLSGVETKYARFAFENWLSHPISKSTLVDQAEIQRTFIQSIQKVFGIGLYFYTVAIGEGAIIIAIATLLAFVNPVYLTILVGYMAIVLAISVALTFPKIKKSANAHELANLSTMETIQWAHILRKEIFFSRRFKYWINRFTESRHIISKAEMDLQRLGTYPRHVAETALMLGASTLLVIIGSSEPNSTEVVTITIFAAATFRIFASALPFQGALTAIRQVRESAESAIASTSRVSGRCDDQIVSENMTNNVISARNLGFKFKDSDRYLFRNLNFDLNKGSQLVIGGRSGLGKSTFIELFLGVLAPTEGFLSVCGVPATSWSTSTSQKIAYVGQSQNTFSGTLLENITFDKQVSINSPEIAEALRFVGLEEWVSSLPDGLDTLMGRDITPSAGQQQRINIARAIYQQPDFLVMDEPLNSLDKAAAKLVAESFNNLSGKVTVIIVTHVHEELLRWDTRVHLDGNAHATVQNRTDLERET